MADTSETATFRIGGRDYHVPALTLYDLEQSRDDIRALSPDLDVVSYATRVIDIAARALQPDDSDAALSMALMMKKSCTFPEAGELVVAMNELLRVSGFNMGEAVAASPGTGISPDSSPNSESVESAAATPSGFVEPLH